MEKKYELLTDQTIQVDGRTLYRIRALRDVGRAHIFGNAKVFGGAYIGSNASLGETSDYLTIGPIGSEGGVLTAWRDALCGVMVNRGCFIGSLTEFEIKVMARHDGNIHGIMYGHAIAMIKAALA